MRNLAVSLLASTTLLTGCFSVHAAIPEDVVRRHAAREDGIEVGAICSHGGLTYSEGAIACMAEQRMTCDATGRWTETGKC